MFVPGFGLVVMLACAIIYYKIGEVEFQSGFLPAGLSVLLWLAPAYFLHWGMLGCLLVQAGLFAALTAYNIIRKRPA